MSQREDPVIDDAASEIASERQKRFSPDATVKLPGYGFALDAMPSPDRRFPVLMGDGDRDWKACTLLVREVCMLKFMEDITNKPEWWRKVHDPEVAGKWKKEAMELQWDDYVQFGDFSHAMANACIKELRLKADLYEETNLIPVMDYSACVIKSDRLIPDHLRAALNTAVARLENVPEHRKDWHPGSDERVLDLVHPSLWPLLYGRSRILPDKRIGLDDCIAHCGKGDILSKPHPLELGQSSSIGYHSGILSLSPRFQWLPCDVVIDAAGQAKIDSYINNLHPVEFADMYPIIEQFITIALPAWDIVYRWPSKFPFQRLHTLIATGVECMVPEICEHMSCDPSHRPLDDDEPPRLEHNYWNDYRDNPYRQKRDNKWFMRTHPIDVPEPGEDDDIYQLPLTTADVQSSGFFDNKRRIQVIVKLANIHLTPDKPDYNGGSWHIEGQLNEHIVSTALFYYDSDNITDCHLNFRTPANAEDLPMELHHEQSDFVSITRLFAIDPDDSTLQDIGSVLTRPGRALFFPNVFQHRVGPFSLADKSRPGHRKILSLFLVDPVMRVISTTNVPPQQKHWWDTNEVHRDGLKIASRLPPELETMIHKNVDFPIDEDEAKKIREELMAERTVLQDGTGNALNEVAWSFCEH